MESDTSSFLEFNSSGVEKDISDFSLKPPPTSTMYVKPTRFSLPE